jgi:hypothetical protein
MRVGCRSTASDGSLSDAELDPGRLPGLSFWVDSKRRLSHPGHGRLANSRRGRRCSRRRRRRNSSGKTLRICSPYHNRPTSFRVPARCSTGRKVGTISQSGQCPLRTGRFKMPSPESKTDPVHLAHAVAEKPHRHHFFNLSAVDGGKLAAKVYTPGLRRFAVPGINPGCRILCYEEAENAWKCLKNSGFLFGYCVAWLGR